MSPTASGTGDGKHPDNSAAYQLNPLGNPLAINHWLNNSGDLAKDVTINFKAGTYVIPASGAGGWGWIQIAGSSSRIVTLNGIPDAATGQLPTLRLESSTPDIYYDGQWNNGIINRFVVQCAKNSSTSKRDYLKKIVISNMELDGNFQEIPGQAGTGHGAPWRFIDVFSDTPASSFYYQLRNMTEVLVGYRFSDEDGLHYGWMRFTRSGSAFTNIFDLVAHDWHPIPDTAIGAGQPPEIPVSTEVVDDGAGGSVLRVGWHPGVATWRFETTESLVPPATWTEYPAGGTSAEIPLGGENPQRYFRLRRP